MRDRDVGQPQILVGVSYGTLVVQRVLALEPDAADAMVLDGVLGQPPRPWEADVNANEVGLEILDACAESAACREAAQRPPLELASAALARLSSDDCGLRKGGFDASTLRRLLHAMSLNGHQGKALVPALLHRAARCSDQDQQRLSGLAEGYFGWQKGSPAFTQTWAFAWPLARHITSVDLWPESRSVDELKAAQQALFLASEQTSEAAAIAAQWPGTGTGPVPSPLSLSPIPVLILHGALDTATFLADARALHERLGPQSRLVEFATGGHFLLANSPITGETMSCGMQILLAFLDAPDQPASTDCVTRVQPLDFVAATEDGRTLSSGMLRTTDLWGANE